MPICNKCGWKTNSDRIFKIHVKTCDIEPVKPESEEVEPEQSETDYKSMTNKELIEVLDVMGIATPRPANKANLIAAIKGGE